MKYLACFLLVLLVGCSSVPVAPKFPEVPERILQKCPQLEKLNEERKREREGERERERKKK